jgi:hypothetical protein
MKKANFTHPYKICSLSSRRKRKEETKKYIVISLYHTFQFLSLFFKKKNLLKTSVVFANLSIKMLKTTKKSF